MTKLYYKTHCQQVDNKMRYISKVDVLNLQPDTDIVPATIKIMIISKKLTTWKPI